MADEKKYTSSYDIKDFALNVLGPKYFDPDVIEGYNIGLLGISLDFMTNTTEDVFNTVPIVINEMYPNLAQMPSSIYNYASLFQESNLMATAPEMQCVLMLPLDDLLSYGTVGADNQSSTFKLDQRTTVRIQDKDFILDYDILFTMKPYRGDYIITATYDRTYNNTMSKIQNPYMKLQKVNYKGVKYVSVLAKMKRALKKSYSKRIIDNDKINSTVIEVAYDNQLANFEVFYRESTDQNYTQLQKKIVNSKAVKGAFCYYRLKDNNTLEISFTNRENYFKPKFNSEVVIEYWETDGAESNFDKYQGDHVEVYRNSEKYENNSTVPVIAIPQSGATGGTDRLLLLELRDKVADSFATVDSFTTEADLQRHFNSFNIQNDTRVTFIKKRDDIFDRLYTAFSISKDNLGSYYKTNTLDLKITRDQFDHQFDQSKRLLLKPCNNFIYDGESTRQMTKVPEDTELSGTEFLYDNPFLMTLSDNGIVGYYLNNINSKIELDYEYVNNDSLVQFICNNIEVYRSAVSREDSYRFRLTLTATDNDIENPIIDGEGNETGKVKVALSFLQKNGEEIGYIECEKKEFYAETLTYVYEGIIHTDDYISSSEAIRISGLKNMETGADLTHMVPMTNLKMNVYSFFEYGEGNVNHKFSHLPGFENTTMSNKYTTEMQRVELVTPLNMLQSRISWYIDDATQTTYAIIKDVPVMKHIGVATFSDENSFNNFIITLMSQYDYMNQIMSKKTNNYSIDMKFYNTYGRANNFVVDETQEVIDTVNCRVHFKVYSEIRSEGANLIQDMKIFIKEYFESVNRESNDGIFISNLIQQLENTFPQIRYVKFVSINDYPTTVQTIENVVPDVELLPKLERIMYIPEYLNIELEDIRIDLLN